MKRYLLAAASVAAFAAAPAAARDHSAFFGLEVGPMWAQDSHVKVGGVPFLDVSHKLGVDGDLIAGYDFGIVRAEIEGAHKWAKHDEYQINPQFSDGDTTFDADGHSRVYSVMGNVLIDLGDNEKVNFYGGGGLGIAWVREKFRIDDDSLGSIKDSGLAWQLIAGVRAPVFRHFDIGLKYRYFNAGKIKDDVGGTNLRSRFRSHSGV